MPTTAPSVSYLSMIESSKRVPSPELLELLAAVFQRDPSWFLDENAEVGAERDLDRRGGAERVPLEPAFLFSKDVLQAAIPELLAQTGTTGRQFAHLLIRSHQEMSRNDFPDLERAAESVGERRFPLDARRPAAAVQAARPRASAGSIASPCSRATRIAKCAACCARSSSRRARFT